MTYQPGARIEVIFSSDPFAPLPTGLQGTITFIDSLGTIHADWDNGRTLGLIPGEDDFKLVQTEKATASPIEKAITEFGEDSNVFRAWSAIHKDFKTISDGKRLVLAAHRKGTSLVLWFGPKELAAHKEAQK